MKKNFFYALLLCLFTLSVNAQVIQQTPKGAQYTIFTHNTGPKIKQDDIVTFQVVERTDKDSVLFSTYTAGHPVQIKVQPSQNIADLMDIFPMMTVNDSAQVRVPVDSVFKGHDQERPAFLKANGNILFTVKVVKVQSLNEAIAERNAGIAKMQQGEAAATEKYIADNKLAVTTTPSGLKYIITSVSEKSSGRKPQPGDTVVVNYVGRTLEGKVFDSSVQAVAQEAHLQQPGRTYEPIKVVLGQGQVIAGWDEGLQLVREGAAAKLIVPSKLAYGSQGAGEDIAPFSTLVFDVNLVRIYPTKHAAAPATAAKTTAKSTTAKKSTTTAKKSTSTVKKSH